MRKLRKLECYGGIAVGAIVVIAHVFFPQAVVDVRERRLELAGTTTDRVLSVIDGLTDIAFYHSLLSEAKKTRL